jgi:hypothetical protein
MMSTLYQHYVNNIFKNILLIFLRHKLITKCIDMIYKLYIKWTTQLNELRLDSWMSWMRTAFSTELNENGFFGWVEWERLFRLGWIRTAFVKVLKTVTVWIQMYTYRSADWSMILQSSLLFFYITSISWRFESHQVILWSHFFYHRDHIVWLISFSSINFSSSIDSVNFREDHVILVIFELNYSRIVNDSLNLIRRTRQIALWH